MLTTTAQSSRKPVGLLSETDCAERVGRLPLNHLDPSDRVIAAQAIAEGLTVITRDEGIGALDARVLCSADAPKFLCPHTNGRSGEQRLPAIPLRRLKSECDC